MMGEIIKGGAASVESELMPNVKDLPCFAMDVGDVWIAPEGADVRLQAKIHTHARNTMRGAVKFRTKTIDGRLYVWRIDPTPKSDLANG